MNGVPVIDITSIVAVESLFRSHKKDPWAKLLAGYLADFFIYSERARYILPVSSPVDTTDASHLPSLLRQLIERDSSVFKAEEYRVDQPRKLRDEYLLPSFAAFSAWVQNNKRSFRAWLDLHNESWVKSGHMARVRPRYIYRTDGLIGLTTFQELCANVGVREEDICYAFDVVLRYPLYGELAGDGTYYLAHPIRERQNLPTMTVEVGQAPPVVLSFCGDVSAIVEQLSQDAYTSLLHDARGIVRDQRIVGLKKGAVDKDTARDIAARLGLPARLKKARKVMATAAALGGAEVSVASTLWSGMLPRRLSRVRWLRWALEWDLEKQTDEASWK